jgi:hypothetical protein
VFGLRIIKVLWNDGTWTWEFQQKRGVHMARRVRSWPA